MNKLKIIYSLILLFFLVPVLGNAAVVKVNTGYYKIPLMTTFSAKGMKASFGHPNTGTKKLLKGQQIIGLQIALWNKSNKDIKVRRNDFSLNGAQINFFVVKEKVRQPLVVKVPAGKVIAIVNYYILNMNISKLSELKLVYSSVTKTYKKKRLLIPLYVKGGSKAAAVKRVINKKLSGGGIVGSWGIDIPKSKSAADGNTAGLMKNVVIKSDGTFTAMYGTAGTWKKSGNTYLINYNRSIRKNLKAYFSGKYLKFPAPAIRGKYCYLLKK